MILAAGLGTRLKPLTDSMPKALVPVGGAPLLDLNIRKLQAQGYDRFVVNIHWCISATRRRPCSKRVGD